MTVTTLRIPHESDIPTPQENTLHILSLFEQWNRNPGTSLEDTGQCIKLLPAAFDEMHHATFDEL